MLVLSFNITCSWCEFAAFLYFILFFFVQMGKKNETLNLNLKPSQNNSNVRAQWTPQQITIFCEAYVDEVFKGNRPSTHFYKLGWRNIEAAFKKNTGKEYPRIKFKHKWDTLKKD